MSMIPTTEVSHHLDSLGLITVDYNHFTPPAEMREQIRIDALEAPLLLNQPKGIVVATSLDVVRQRFHEIIDFSEMKYAYVTGGFECAPHHQQLMRALERLELSVILGLEPDAFIRQKGREPLLTLDERLAFWKVSLPAYSILFSVPDGTDNYNLLALDAGVLRHPNVIHISSNDPPDVLAARRSRALTEDHFLVVRITDINGCIIHTSQLFEEV